MEPRDAARFREEQRFRQPWLWALILVSLVVPLWFELFAPPGRPSTGVLALVIGGGLIPLALLWFMRLEVEVRNDGIHFRFLASV